MARERQEKEREVRFQSPNQSKPVQPVHSDASDASKVNPRISFLGFHFKKVTILTLKVSNTQQKLE